MLPLGGAREQRLAQGSGVGYSGAMTRFAALLLALATASACRSYPLPATPSVRVSDQVEEVNGTLRMKAAACTGVSLRPETEMLSAETVVAFLSAHGVTPHAVNERPDLVYLDVPSESGRTVRLRVAVLASGAKAGEELSQALAQQGSGAWGVHRANLAVLAPAGHVDDIIAFATKTKLACWGVLTLQQGDDAIVVPGGYLEF